MPAILVGGFRGGRKNFGNFLNENKLGGGYKAVEIGTHRGEFARQLLDGWYGERLYCVDPYTVKYDTGDPISYQPNRLDDVAAMRSILAQHSNRYELLRMTSVLAAMRIKDASLAFVYIDGCHQADYVRQDLESWWPKLVSGGILAGHDFIMTNEHTGGWGKIIQPVVMQFAESVSRPVYVVAENDGSPWSFYLER